MLVSQFALVFLAGWLLFLVNSVGNRPAPVGGPYYYADPGGRPNALRPGNRISVLRAYRARAHLQVIYDGRSLPVLIKHMRGRQEVYAEILDWDKGSRLYRRVLRLPGGRLISRQDLPRPWRETNASD